MGPSAKRRKPNNYGVEEVKFDFDARQDYLSGFHKRKQARIKHAQDVAAKKEREEKIEERKQLREQRKKDLEEHVKAVNDAVKKAEAGNFDSDEEREQAAKIPEAIGVDGTVREEEQSNESDSAREEEYIDEDKHTTVTVEPMNGNSADEEAGENDEAGHKRPSAIAKTQKAKIAKTAPKAQPTAKRKKFRYETKSERKASKLQQSMKNHKAAAARRQK